MTFQSISFFSRSAIWRGLTVLVVVVILLMGLPVLAQESLTADSGPEIAFTTAVYQQSEASGAVSIPVQASGTVSETVTVDFVVAGITAVSDEDYTASNGTLSFDASTVEQTISVTLLDDTIAEADEYVTLTLYPPTNGRLGAISQTTLTILDDDPEPTAAPTATATQTAVPPTATATHTPAPNMLLTDRYESNNSIENATLLDAVQGRFCDLTLWPQSDRDYYQFSAVAGWGYTISTSQLAVGVDTTLIVYDGEGREIGHNDNHQPGQRGSQFAFTAAADGPHYVHVADQGSGGTEDRRYCLQIIESGELPTETPTATVTPISLTGDSCEANDTVVTACLIGENDRQRYHFVPLDPNVPDRDYFRLAVKPGVTYTCETLNLSSVTDTNIIFLDGNGNDFSPQLGNDDRAVGDRSSRLSYDSTYNGSMIILVQPVSIPASAAEAAQFEYDLVCKTAVTTTPPTPTATRATVTGAVQVIPTIAPFPTMTETPAPTATPEPAAEAAADKPSQPNVQFVALPTTTAVQPHLAINEVHIALYYDSNTNEQLEQGEGITEIAVALYDTENGRLLAFGYTNPMGMISFRNLEATAPVRLIVPYLGYTQFVTLDNQNIQLKVAPQMLPQYIP